jgi:hypothetical protein
MEDGCQFRETQPWPRLLTWPLAAAAFLVPIVLFNEFDNVFGIVLQAMAITCIPLTWLLLEWMGPTVEVRDGTLTYMIWPFYRRQLNLAEVKSCVTKTFHPPGNDVQYHYRGYVAVPDTHYVELSLVGDRVVDITTNHPERLADAIRRAQAVEHHDSRHRGVVAP